MSALAPCTRRAWLGAAAVFVTAPLAACARSPRAPRRRFGRARVRVVLENRMGASFRLVGATLILDQKPIYRRASPELAAATEVDVYDGVLEAGEHDLMVKLQLRGDGSGVFSYLRGYRFEAKTEQRFEIDGDERVTVRVTAHERGGPTTPLERRPAIAVRLAPR